VLKLKRMKNDGHSCASGESWGFAADGWVLAFARMTVGFREDDGE